MKKLFLFILVLFGNIGIMSLADSMCGPNGQFDPGSNTCRPVQYQNVYTPPETKIKYSKTAFAYDNITGAYGIGYNKNKSKAKKEALSRCGTENCKIVFYDVAGTVVASSNGIVVSGTYIDGGRTMEECKKQGGIDCKIIYRYSPCAN